MPYILYCHLCNTYGCNECGEEGSCIQAFGGKPEGKKPLGRPRCRREGNMEMDIQELECGRKGWIDPAQDRYRWRALVNAVMNFRVP